MDAIRSPQAAFMRNDDLISITLDSKKYWTKGQLLRFALINKAWLRPALSRLWRDSGSLATLLGTLGVQPHKLTDDFTYPRKAYVLDEPLGKEMMNILKQYSPWVRELTNRSPRYGGAIIHRLLLKQFRAVLGCPDPFPAVKKLDLYFPHGFSRVGEAATVAEFLAASPAAVRSLIFHGSKTGVSSLSKRLSALASLRELTIEDCLNGEPGKKRPAFISRLEVTLSKLIHLRDFKISSHWLSPGLVRSLSQLPSLASLCGSGHETKCPYFDRSEERLETTGAVGFPSLTSLEIYLPAYTHSDILDVFGQKITRARLCIEALADDEPLEGHAYEVACRFLGGLPDLKELSLRTPCRFEPDGEELELGAFHDLTFESLQALETADSLESFCLTYYSCIAITGFEMVQLTSAWRHLKTLRMFEEPGFEDYSDREYDDEDEDTFPFSIAFLAPLLRNMPLLENLYIPWHPSIPGAGDLPEPGYPKHGIKSLSLHYSFQDAEESGAKDLTRFLVSILKPGARMTDISTGSDGLQFGMIMSYFILGRFPIDGKDRSELVIPEDFDARVFEDRSLVASEVEGAAEAYLLREKQEEDATTEEFLLTMSRHYDETVTYSSD